MLRNEVNIVDLLVLTAIKSQDSKLYQFIHHNKEIFTASPTDYDDVHSAIQLTMDDGKIKESLKNRYKDMRNSFDKIDIVEPMLKEILPQFKNLLKDPSVRHETNNSEWKKNQRIADPDHFDRIFLLSVPEEQIPFTKLKEIIALQNKPSDFSEAINSYNYNDKRELIELFSIHINEFKDENLITIAKAIISIVTFEDNKRYESSLPNLTVFFIEALFSKDNASVNTQFERYEKLFSEDYIDPFIQYGLLRTIAGEIRIYQQDEQAMQDAIEKSEFRDRFTALENAIVTNLNVLAKSGKLQKHQKLMPLLYTWKRLRPDELSKFVKELLSTENGVVDFITSMLSYTRTSSSRYSEKITPKVNKSTVEDFTNEEKLVIKVRAIKEKYYYHDLPDKSKEAIEALLWRIDNPDETPYSINKDQFYKTTSIPA